MSDAVYSDPAVLQRLAWSLGQYEGRAREGLSSAALARSRVEETVQQALRARRAAFDQAQADYAAALARQAEARARAAEWQAQAAMASEQGLSVGACPIVIPDTRVERAALEAAEHRLAQAKRASELLARASGEYGRAHSRFEQSLAVVAGECRAELGALAQRLDIYLAAQLAAQQAWAAEASALVRGSGSAGGASSSGAAAGRPGGGGGSACGFDQPAGFPAGIVMVPVSAIVGTPPSSTRADYSWDDLAWAHDAFNRVIRPGVARGMGADDFALRDAREGRMGMRSYSDTFAGFFRADTCIQLEPVGDGTFTIANGRHRVHSARMTGIDFVPASIAGGTP